MKLDKWIFKSLRVWNSWHLFLLISVILQVLTIMLKVWWYVWNVKNGPKSHLSRKANINIILLQIYNLQKQKV